MFLSFQLFSKCYLSWKLCLVLTCNTWKLSRVIKHVPQGIFPPQGSNSGLLHCRWILHHLSHQGSPRILEWVAYSFSRGSSWPRNGTGVSCIAGGFFFTSRATGKPQNVVWYHLYVGSIKHNKLMTITTRKRTHRLVELRLCEGTYINRMAS